VPQASIEERRTLPSTPRLRELWTGHRIALNHLLFHLPVYHPIQNSLSIPSIFSRLVVAGNRLPKLDANIQAKKQKQKQLEAQRTAKVRETLLRPDQQSLTPRLSLRPRQGSSKGWIQIFSLH
jgi:hypothetical protein